LKKLNLINEPTLYYKNKKGKLYYGDMTGFKINGRMKNKCSLVITDPPYAKKFNYLWDFIGKKAEQLLKEGGSFISLLGHRQIPIAIDVLNKYLNYWWLCGLENSGRSKRIFVINCYAHFKPALWYVNGKREKITPHPNDFIKTNIKDWNQSYHKQKQPLVFFEHYIEKLTNSNDLVVDFFAGSGTSIIAADRMRRRWIAIEKEEKNCELIVNRLNNDFL